ncbi:MAG TPA: right-handed parallel beta-helix repeat-containing protein [Chitinophaga sp.]|uniref:right-handed parallel beta-helix repeat-containing protein n=1 Tax=Chitinophaga sp. TaxID=1869181 RepID=UPI002DBC92EE|nr:right-handed parallel beta-helix repeat-containing protein [Chitinophaga sp.]HEU4555785.1 right-handed parallel beta-helix repeat-containing protein [Chitinophaga sp.]
MFLIAAITVLLASCNSGQVPRRTPEPTQQYAPAAKGKTYILTPDRNGRLNINNTNRYYKPGDVLILKGNFSAVYFTNLSGSAKAPIIIKNPPGAVTAIGAPGWNGGSWAEALSFTNCHYLIVGSGDNNKANFVIKGSTQPGRPAYFDLVLRGHTDNIEIRYLTITNGGTGIWAKTDPQKNDAGTWYPNSQMENLSIHHVEISGTHNEAMYIGHTATYWDLTAGLSFYDSPSKFKPDHKYVQPIKWRNVKIYNNYVHDIGADGIQTAAIDQLEIYNNEVANWALQHNSSHNGGILIGGRTTNTNTHDNYVHNGWGELLQFYGSGENNAKHIIHNNLFRDNMEGNDGMSIRGTDNAIVIITNNTVARTGGNSIRLSGYRGMKGVQIANGNALLQPRTNGKPLYPNAYIYTEGGAAVAEGQGSNANVKFATVTAAIVDTDNFYMPHAGSPLADCGYRKNRK